MPENLVFTGYCEKCGSKFTYRFRKDQLQLKSGGIYSGVFLHNSKDNKEIHAVLAYFDSNLADRGTEDSNVIQTSDISLECVQVNVLPSLKEGITTNRDIKVLYEWLINEYISYFKNTEILESKRLSPVLNKILEDSKSQSKIYENFALISEKTGDKIVFDSQKDFNSIEDSELKKAYQTLFDQIRIHFREESENEALEASRKLGLKIVTLWKEIVKLGLSEDMFRVLEGLLSSQKFSGK